MLTNRKKILFTYYSMDIGGSTTSLLSILNSLDPQKYEIYLMLYRNTGELLPFVPSYVTLLEPAAQKKSFYTEFKKILKLLTRKTFYQGIHYQLKNKEKKFPVTLHSEIQARYFSRKPNTKFDIAIGGMEGWSDKYVAYQVEADIKLVWFHSLFSKISETPSLEINWLNKINYIVNISKECEEDFLDRLPQFANKCIIIKNMLDQNIVLQRSKDKMEDKDYDFWKNYEGFKIITVSRLDPAKALHRVAMCAEIMKKNGCDFKWLIVGNGDERVKLHKLIIRKHLEHYVYLVGAKKNPYPFIKESNVFCLTSFYEGTPVTVKESMMLGIIPVVTRYKSAENQIQNNETGFIVDNEDTAVVEVLGKLYSSKETQNRIKMNLSKLKFSDKESMRILENIWSKHC